MSDLLTNLNSIYTTKLQIKEAIGTSSDVFADYPGYISSMVLPDGTAYITANGVSDISSYQYVDVDVPSGPTPTGTYNITDNGTYDVTTYASAYVNVSGGDDYQWIDAASYTMVIGEKYAFNGQLSANAQTQITSEFTVMYPALAPYLNWYVYGIGGENNSSNWSKTAIIETPGDLPGHGVIAKGTWTEPVTGNPMFIVDELYAAKYAGGNGGLTIQSNGNQDVTRYSYVNVNVSGGSGTSYEFIYLHNSSNNIWNSSWSDLEVGSSYEFICRLNDSGYSDGTGDVPLGYYAYGMYKGDGLERPVCISGASSSLSSYTSNNMVIRGDYVGKARLVDDTMTGIFSLGEMHYANMGGIGERLIYEDGIHDVSEYDSVYVEGIPQYTIYDELDGKNPAPSGWYLTISGNGGEGNPVTVYWLIILENAQSNVDVSFEFDITKVLAHVDIDSSNLDVHLTFWDGSSTVNFYGDSNDMSGNNPNFVTPWALDQNYDCEIHLSADYIYCIGFNENVSNGHNYFWFAHPSTAESI